MEFDIYDNLGENEVNFEEEATKLRGQIQQLEAHIVSLEADVEKFQTKISEMKTIKINLERNISELYKTAKAEIDRKDKMISELRTQIDQFTLQRKMGYANKRPRENSYHSHESDSAPKRLRKEHEKARRTPSPRRRSRSRSREKTRDHERKYHRSKKEHRSDRDRNGSSHKESGLKIKWPSCDRVRKKKEEKQKMQNEENKQCIEETGDKVIMDKLQSDKSPIESEKAIQQKPEMKKIDVKVTVSTDKAISTMKEDKIIKKDMRRSLIDLEKTKIGIQREIDIETDSKTSDKERTKDSLRKITARRTSMKSKDKKKLMVESKKESLSVIKGLVANEMDKQERTDSVNINVKGTGLEEGVQEEEPKKAEADVELLNPKKSDPSENTAGGLKTDEAAQEKVLKDGEIIGIVENQKKENGGNISVDTMVPEARRVADDNVKIKVISDISIKCAAVNIHENTEKRDNNENNADKEENHAKDRAESPQQIMEEICAQNTPLNLSQEKKTTKSAEKNKMNRPKIEDVTNKLKAKIEEENTDKNYSNFPLHETQTSENHINKDMLDLVRNAAFGCEGDEDKFQKNLEILKREAEGDTCQKLVENVAERKSIVDKPQSSLEVVSASRPGDKSQNKSIFDPIFENKKPETESQKNSEAVENSKRIEDNPQNNLDVVKDSCLEEKSQNKSIFDPIFENKKPETKSQKNFEAIDNGKRIEDHPQDNLEVVKDSCLEEKSQKESIFDPIFDHKKLETKSGNDFIVENTPESRISPSESQEDFEMQESKSSDKTTEKKKPAKKPRIRSSPDYKPKKSKDFTEVSSPIETSRVLRSATRRNSNKLEKSSESTSDQENQKIFSTNSSVTLTDEGDIPVLHISDCDKTPGHGYLFDANLTTDSTSTPLNDGYSLDMQMLKEDLNISLDQSLIEGEKVSQNSSIWNSSVKSSDLSGNCNNTSSARKRRRVILTLID